MAEEYEEMHFVILNHETGRVIFKKMFIPVNCLDVEAYLDDNHILKKSECSFMCSKNPIPVIMEQEFEI